MIQCLLVDDESPAIELLKSHIETLGNLQIVGYCYNAIDAFEILKKNKIDLLFLDIEMPIIKGIDFLKTLNNPPKVIITTAYRDYALEGYDLDIIDYLLKPISFLRFVKAIDRYHERTKNSSNLSIEQEQTFFFVNINKKRIKVAFDDIVYIESLKDYIRIHTVSERLVVKGNIGKIGKQLPEALFIRTHRSYIVALNKVTAFTRQDVELNNIEIPIGPKYSDEVSRRISAK